MKGAIGRRIKKNQGINYVDSLTLGRCFSPGVAISNGVLVSDVCIILILKLRKGFWPSGDLLLYFCLKIYIYANNYTLWRCEAIMKSDSYPHIYFYLVKIIISRILRATYCKQESLFHNLLKRCYLHWNYRELPAKKEDWTYHRLWNIFNPIKAVQNALITVPLY